MEEFLSLFKFDSSHFLSVGIERERFITNGEGVISPRAKDVLEALPDNGKFGYELSACQLEDRIGPIPINYVKRDLRENDKLINQALSKFGLKDLFAEVAPADMDLSVFDDPTGRYQTIVKDMPANILLAACRVAGTHVHIGMSDIETALLIYNKVIEAWPSLCEVINHSHGQRLEIYKEMAPRYVPRPYATVEEFYEDAVGHGFVVDPRKNWQLIRITIHGTIEFRMGGATSNHDEIYQFAQACQDICMAAYRAAYDKIHSASNVRPAGWGR